MTIANYSPLNYNCGVHRRRNILIAVVALAIVAGIVAVAWRPGALPQAASLLPAADAYIYLDLHPLRAAGLFKNMPTVDPDYAQFVRDSGFQFERDLDQAAFAVHLPPPADADSSKPQPETRYSEVFVGRFDHAKLAAYLRQTAAATRDYGNSLIYEIPLPGRTVRVAVLSKNMVAASNADDELIIRGIIDRHAETFGSRGNEMLRGYYRHVPLGSVAWAIARTTPSGNAGNARFVLPGGFDLFFPQGTVVVATVRYLGSVQFRADAFTRSAEDAQRVADQLNAFLAVARTVEIRAQAGEADPDVKAFFDSISVSQSEDHADLNATIPPGLLKKIVSEAPPISVVAPVPEPEKKPTVQKRRHRKKK